MSDFSTEPAPRVPSGPLPPVAPTVDPVQQAEPAPATPPRKKKPIAIILLAVLLLGAIAAGIYIFVQLDEARSLIDQQKRELKEQQELIDKKETFGAAMEGLLDTARSFDGALMGSLVPMNRYTTMAGQAWLHRWNGNALDHDTETVVAARTELETLLATAATQASTNGTGTTNEAVIDQLGRGFVTSLVDDADTVCSTDVLACVMSNDPFTVHFDAADNSQPYMNDWLRTGLSYHEFAHVLQMTNPKPTETAVAAFGGDHETMADCYALTYLDGWTLDHRVWVSDFQYWDVSIGYGYTCDEGQRQVIRDWYAQLPIAIAPISQ